MVSGNLRGGGGHFFPDFSCPFCARIIIIIVIITVFVDYRGFLLPPVLFSYGDRRRRTLSLTAGRRTAAVEEESRSRRDRFLRRLLASVHDRISAQQAASIVTISHTSEDCGRQSLSTI